MLGSLGRRLTPERARLVDAVLGLELRGPEGGVWTVDARAAGGSGVLEGAPEAHGLSPRLSASLTPEDFLRLARGELNPAFAAMTGRLRLRGDLSFATRLARLLGP